MSYVVSSLGSGSTSSRVGTFRSPSKMDRKRCCSAAALSPRVEFSATWFPISSMDDSIESAATSFSTRTVSRAPIRCARATTCCSKLRSQIGSIRKMYETKLKSWPSEPVRSVTKTAVSGSCSKERSEEMRSSRPMERTYTARLILCRRRALLTKYACSKNCENTIALRIFFSDTRRLGFQTVYVSTSSSRFIRKSSLADCV
mmetsp:Transcript_29311/g.71372  ORF Transcript_29311/g.71372 Transcript_29311/m.71372 type:complete len:202 (-) Transcript_29311:293-898(-)